ncbi:MAG: GTPase HflX [Gemmatimonadota bacterium]
MIELDDREERERAILVGAPASDLPKSVADEHLRELGRLADTAGADVVGTVVQRLGAPHPRFYIGKGKVAELKELVEERAAGLVVFDDELSPAQGRNLEQALDLRVVDRAELILDIFAFRARTSEAQMQVELAQLEYLLPRLKRMWTHLSRIRGGIGLRGPGETQLESDRRIINRRIRDLRAKLQVVERRRETQRRARAGEFQVALVGYTNAGKSSILRGLSGSDLFVEDRLFATLDPATRAVELDGTRLLLTDTVGFIRKLPHDLVASFRATLEEAASADVLVHVIDASASDWPEHLEVVREVLADLGLRGHPTLHVFNKIDRLTHEEEDALRLRLAGRFDPPPVLCSAHEVGGLDELRRALLDRVRAERPEVSVSLPASDGEALAAIYREGEVVSTNHEGARVDVVARLPRPMLGRLRARPGVRVAGG